LELHTPSAFKFFTFSRLMVEGRRFKKEGERMKLLSPNVHFFFSTMQKYIGVTFVEGLLEKPEVKIGKAEFVVSQVGVVRERKIKRKEKFVTLSPISVTTVKENGGRKRIWDLSPKEPKFYENLKRNLVRKFGAFYGREPEEDELEIKVLGTRQKRIRVKNTEHRCYELVFEAEGSKELLEVGYKAGFGERNSMGFGMVKVV